MTPPTVNAYYDPQMNDINFPAGVLQPPLYDPKMDDAPNYGNTGSTIGHELTHGFDDEGRQFDAQGNLKDWWTPAGRASFDERADCVRDQYAAYTVIDDIHINSKLTSGEDVADLGGTLLAYIAWKEATANEDLAVRRRLHAGPALLHRLRAVGLREPPAREPARHRASRTRTPPAVPHQRHGRQHARVREGFRLQARHADDQARGEGLLDLVARHPGCSRMNQGLH